MKMMKLIVVIGVLGLFNSAAWADNSDAEATIRLMSKSEAELPEAVTREITLPAHLLAENPEDRAAAAEKAEQGLVKANERTEHRDAGQDQAEDARDRVAKDRPVYIAGSVSNYGLLTGSEPGWRDLAYFQGRSELSEGQAQANLLEQAEILAEAGVDFLLAESTGSNIQRKWVVEACLATGLPVWTGFKVRLDEGDPTVRIGYRSELALADGFHEIASLGGTVITIFHSSVASTDAALDVAKKIWSGPVGIYPEAERRDYVDTYRDRTVPTRLTPEEFLGKAQTWVAQGVQVVGGCCGVELEYIRPLRELLPSHVPDAA